MWSRVTTVYSFTAKDQCLPMENLAVRQRVATSFTGKHHQGLRSILVYFESDLNNQRGAVDARKKHVTSSCH